MYIYMKQKIFTLSTIIGCFLSLLFLFISCAYFLSYRTALNGIENDILSALPSGQISEQEMQIREVATIPYYIQQTMSDNHLIIAAIVLCLIFLFSQIIDLINKEFSRKSCIIWLVINLLLYFVSLWLLVNF